MEDTPIIEKGHTSLEPTTDPPEPVTDPLKLLTDPLESVIDPLESVTYPPASEEVTSSEAGKLMS